MASLRDALRFELRRPSPREHHAPSDVLFVVCSENYQALSLLAACEPVVVLQTLGGARDPADGATRATFEFAVASSAVRRVVVCGHRDCRALPSDGSSALAATPAGLFAQCARLRDDPRIGALLRDYGVTVQALWFDERDGGVYACDLEGGAAPSMQRVDVGRVIARLRAPTA